MEPPEHLNDQFQKLFEGSGMKEDVVNPALLPMPLWWVESSDNQAGRDRGKSSQPKAYTAILPKLPIDVSERVSRSTALLDLYLEVSSSKVHIRVASRALYLIEDTLKVPEASAIGRYN